MGWRLAPGSRQRPSAGLKIDASPATRRSGECFSDILATLGGELGQLGSLATVRRRLLCSLTSWRQYNVEPSFTFRKLLPMINKLTVVCVMYGRRFAIGRWALCLAVWTLSGVPSQPLPAATYFVDSAEGNDANTGLTREQAWRTLERASEREYGPEDQLRFKRGCTFRGALELRAQGACESPVAVASYGEGPLPIIDAEGYRAAVHLKSCRHAVVQDLEITADGGDLVDGAAEKRGDRSVGRHMVFIS